MWLQVQNRLLTADRLLKWNIQVDPVCQLCHTGNDTRDHLFFECCFAQLLWKRLMKWMQFQWPGVHNWMLHYQTILQLSKGRSKQAQLIKMVYAEYIHAIWIERNTRVFEGGETQGEQNAKAKCLLAATGWICKDATVGN
ncbi:uncharacterized protein LOC132062267 [Lycium ferocissimum]|uniref:uncharacterized protein LOC132062267 n=1 Tax=Lycium ferocissimum TaxID=112874 RepID=UPI002814D494|nr:uncharacterized protein LOC132062267 [Lycium ferocissimum]